MTGADEVDVVVIGSGFGGSVAALRFAEAGHRVVVLERGNHVSRSTFEVDFDALWKPERGSYGMHDIRSRGRNLIPWVGAAVGGGSHVFAGTLKRRESFDGYPAAIRATDMTPFYDRAEDMLGGTPYPDYPPYSEVRALRLMVRAGERLKELEPALVESYGPIHLGISFAPRDGTPGAEFVNKHGCKQRYYDPTEQSLLGGDIDAKNSLDRNYLYLAQKAGTSIRPLSEVDRLERLPDGRWQVTYRHHVPPTGWALFRQRWLTLTPAAAMSPAKTILARRVVVSCGAVGSTELLLRNRDVHGTLRNLSRALGRKYTTNGDFVTLITPFPLLVPVWAAFVALVICLVLGQWWGAGIAAAIYYIGLALSGRPYDPDIGTTNSEYIRFVGPNGEPQHVYIESGRYPTPGRTIFAIIATQLAGRFSPTVYRALALVTDVLRFLVPPLGAIARSYPIPLLTMGRDRAYGELRLDDAKRAVIDYDIDANRGFYEYLDRLGKKVASAAKAYWLPNIPYLLFKKQEVPHNQGGVPMADDPEHGVVDHAGRVFGEPDLMVLDGSIIPESVGPNPALTILAVAERAMEVVVAQLETGASIEAEVAGAAEEVA